MSAGCWAAAAGVCFSSVLMCHLAAPASWHSSNPRCVRLSSAAVSVLCVKYLRRRGTPLSAGAMQTEMFWGGGSGNILLAGAFSCAGGSAGCHCRFNHGPLDQLSPLTVSQRTSLEATTWNVCKILFCPSGLSGLADLQKLCCRDSQSSQKCLLMQFRLTMTTFVRN